MLKLFKRDARSILGIDISSISVKIIELSRKEGNWCIEGFGCEILPPDAVEGHTIKDIDAVASTIRHIVSGSHLQSKLAILALPDSAVISKILQVNDDLNEAEIEEFIIMEADKYIPYPIDEITIDFEILGQSLKIPDRLDVLMVASRSENVSSRVSALTKAGLQVKIVDVESFAIERAIQLLATTLPAASDKIIAVIDIRGEFTNLYVLHQMKIIYTHQDEFGKVVNPSMEMFLLQVKRALQFFFSTSHHGFVDYILLAGEAERCSDLAPLIEKNTRIPTSIANCAQHLRLGDKLNTTSILHDAPSLLMACGLALRNVG